MKAAKTSKNLKEMPYSPQKKLLERKENNIAPAKTNAPISQTSSECLKLTIQTYWMRNKEIKRKLGQLQEEISKACFPVSADLSIDFKSIILETDQRKISPFMSLFWEEQPKYLHSSQNNAIYHEPWTLMLMSHIRQSIYLCLTNVLSTSFLMFHIKYIW